MIKSKLWICSLILITLATISIAGCASEQKSPTTKDANVLNQPLKLSKEFKLDKKKMSAYIEEPQIAKDFPVSTTYGYYYAYSMSALDREIKKEFQDKLIAALKNMQASDGGFTWDSHTKGSDIYDTYCAVWTLKKLGALNQIDSAKVEGFIKSCSNKDGGYCFMPGQESQPIHALHGIATLTLLGKGSSVDKSSVVEYLKPLQAKEGGFSLKKGFPGNVKTTYAALHLLKILDSLDIVDKEKATTFLVSDQSKDGGFSYMVGDKNINIPENAYYALSSLRLLDALDKIKARPLSGFLRDRYTADGGFCDVYYGNTKYPTAYYGIACLAELGYLKSPAISE
ncbi:MAG: prenyltransferase/squalene oxidase repeat-containing protein [Candidatus Aquicultor sp.]